MFTSFSFSSRNLSNHEFSRFSLRGQFHRPKDTKCLRSCRLPKSSPSQKVFGWAGFSGLIHLDRLLIIHVHLRSSQSPGSLKIKAVASLIRETWTIAPTSLLKKNLTYSSLFKAYFMKSFAAAKSSLVFIKNRCRGSRSHMFFKIGVLKNFTIFTGKHLCWSLFLIKLQAFRLFSCEYCKIVFL